MVFTKFLITITESTFWKVSLIISKQSKYHYLNKIPILNFRNSKNFQS